MGRQDRYIVLEAPKVLYRSAPNLRVAAKAVRRIHVPTHGTRVGLRIESRRVSGDIAPVSPRQK